MRKRGDSSSEAISTVLGAILILGLLVSVIAIAKVVYVPEMKKQAEADHMTNAQKDFMDYKTALDLAAQSGKGTIITTRIEMGGGAIPIIDSSMSSGSLAVDPDYGKLNITAYWGNGTKLSTAGRENMGSVVFRSNNKYWIDQNFNYEDGMVILSQNDGRTMLTEPNIAASKDLDPTIIADLLVIPIRLQGNPNTISTSGIALLTTTLNADGYSYVTSNVTNVTITVTTDYAPEWKQFFKTEFETIGLRPGNLNDDGNYYNVTISPDGKTVKAKVWCLTGDHIRISLSDANFNLPTVVTPTPSPTPSVTPSPTPTPVKSALIDLCTNITTQNTRNITPWMVLNNTGRSTLDIGKIKIRYYFKVETSTLPAGLKYRCDYADPTYFPDPSNIQGTFVTTDNINYYLEIYPGNSGSKQLNADAVSGPLKVQIWRADGSLMDQSNDYSFNGISQPAYTPTDKVTVYYGNNQDLIWGTPPA